MVTPKTPGVSPAVTPPDSPRDRTLGVLRALHRQDANFRVATAMVLIEVERWHPRGCTSKHLQLTLGMTQAAVSRAILRLSSQESHAHEVGIPLGLVQAALDPHETRRHLVTLTAQGAYVLSRT